MLNSNSIRLKACRRRSGLDQAELAELVGVSPAVAVSKYERGERLPALSALIAYEIAFEMPVTKLLPDAQRAEEERMLRRAGALMARLKRSQTRASAHKVSFLSALVRRLEGAHGE